jgi:hypothetical protein
MRNSESISSLQKFNECPRCYWLSYVAGLGDDSNPAQRLGTEVHEAIKRYHLGKSVNDISEEAGKLFSAYASNVPATLLDKVEHEFLIPVENIANGEKLPIKLHGFIDGITTKTHWLHEHKTSSSYWKPEDADTNIQATAYAYAYFMETGILPEGIRFNILKKNKIDCKYQSIETYRTLEDFVYFFNWIKKTLVEMTTSDFLPKQTRFNSHHRPCPLHVIKRLDKEQE